MYFVFVFVFIFLCSRLYFLVAFDMGDINYKEKYLKYKGKYLGMKRRVVGGGSGSGSGSENEEWINFVVRVPGIKKGTVVTSDQYRGLPGYYKRLFERVNDGYNKMCDGVGEIPTKGLIEGYQYRALPENVKFNFREVPVLDGLEPQYVWDGNVEKNRRYWECMCDRVGRIKSGSEISHHVYMDLPDELRKMFMMQENGYTRHNLEMWGYAKFVRR